MTSKPYPPTVPRSKHPNSHLLWKIIIYIDIYIYVWEIWEDRGTTEVLYHVQQGLQAGTTYGFMAGLLVPIAGKKSEFQGSNPQVVIQHLSGFAVIGGQIIFECRLYAPCLGDHPVKNPNAGLRVCGWQLRCRGPQPRLCDPFGFGRFFWAKFLWLGPLTFPAKTYQTCAHVWSSMESSLK